jgi:cytochrome c
MTTMTCIGNPSHGACLAARRCGWASCHLAQGCAVILPGPDSAGRYVGEEETMIPARALALSLFLATAPSLGLPLPARAQEAGDAAAGQRVFNQCRACHVIENNGRNGVGPNLFGVVGRRAAGIENFRYSANMRSLGEGGHVWTPENLRAYLRNPKDVAPQGSMAFAGLRNDQQLADVIAFLGTQRN